MSDYISKLRDLLLQQSKTGRLSSLLDSIYGAASTGAEAYGAANSPMAPQHAAGLLGTIADLTPVVGDVKSAYEGVQAAREGDWAGAGLGLLGALPFVPGITAWHGSPHKFDKFSLDKIGTGEGAQAYGHGLYLAESPDVAREYAQTLDPMAQAARSGIDAEGTAARVLQGVDFNKQRAIDELTRRKNAPHVQGDAEWAAKMDAAIAHIQGVDRTSNLYKTDIPDEAVARFLDWDKPLSQQSEEVRNLIAQRGPLDDPRTFGFKNPEKVKGADIYSILARGSQAKPGIGEAGVSEAMRQAGIPGIRYLDGGSRSAGQGSSNFVAFDPEMIRILERNGQATGLEPWKPGEYRLKDLITK